jgi:hypothetical protein
MIEVFGVTFWVPGLLLAATAISVAIYLKVKGN